MRLNCLLLAGSILPLAAAERTVDPTFLHRYIPAVEEKAMDVSTPACHYKPLFGAGDSQSAIARGVARFGQIVVSPGGACNAVNYPAEEQAYVILEGAAVLHYASETAPVKKNDFMYLPAGIAHAISNPSNAPVRLFVMGFRIPANQPPPAKLQIANLDEVREQTVSGHPDSVLYKLMMGGVESKRDRIAAGHLLTSLFLMDFQPGGTNFPHHHDSEEEIYVLLDGSGEMVAGGGMDGIEGRFPAKPGDAYFFRLNCTVGFYNGSQSVAHILAVRSLYPGRQK
jgi:mannose-6-phosphate isomerase-like protein (cupin superfamily)